jgi:hypothetical protein
MRTLLMVCGLSLIPLVAVADPADLPNANLPGNSASLPNSNLPGSVPDDHPVQLPNTDTTPSTYWPVAWSFQPAPSVGGRNLQLALSPEQVDAIATLQRQLDETRAETEAARQEAAVARDEAARARSDAATLQSLLPGPPAQSETR